MQPLIRVSLAALLPAAVLATACSSSGGKPSDGGLSGSITIFAASSLQGTFTQLGQSFQKAHPGTTVKFNFGSSGDLATQITQGAPGDVFASAAPTNMQTVVSAGDAKSPTNFVRNKMEIATTPGNPQHVTTLADLAKGGTTVALCVVTAPCGALAQAILQKANVKLTPKASEPDVKTTLSVVEAKEVDAGMVYVTDVMAAGSSVTGVKIPDALNGTTEYPIATLTHSKNANLATAWVSYLETAKSLKVFEAAGFLAP
jgi:molybdate transport system substrate-binding protein